MWLLIPLNMDRWYQMKGAEETQSFKEDYVDMFIWNKHGFKHGAKHDKVFL
jgi:hypothetical protein